MEGVQQIHLSRTEIRPIPYDTLKRIVEQIPETRELLQLLNQLHPALPIQDFESLEQSCENGMIRFRDMQIPIRVLKEFIPDFVFPIDDEKNLIERLYHVIRVVPAFAGFDSSKVDNIQYISQMNFLSLFKDWLKNYSMPVGEYIIKNQDE